MDVEDDYGTCDQCKHPLTLHALINGDNNPLNGGVMLCPVAGCQCYATWGVNGDKPAPFTQVEIDRLRTAVQTGEFM